ENAYFDSRTHILVASKAQDIRWVDRPVDGPPEGRSVPIPCLEPIRTSQTLSGYARTAPAITASDMIFQKRAEERSIAPTSVLIRRAMTGIIPAITAFIDSHSDMKDRRTASMYDPPSIRRMNSAWKTSSPKAKPATGLLALPEQGQEDAGDEQQ